MNDVAGPSTYWTNSGRRYVCSSFGVGKGGSGGYTSDGVCPIECSINSGNNNFHTHTETVNCGSSKRCYVGSKCLVVDRYSNSRKYFIDIVIVVEQYCVVGIAILGKTNWTHILVRASVRMKLPGCVMRNSARVQ